MNEGRLHPAGPTLGMRKILVCIPTYSGGIDYSTELSLQRAQLECTERGWDFAKLIRSGDALISRARDVLVSSFLAMSDCTDMLFVDADVAWKKGSFAQLMSHDVDIVAGLYREKRNPENYTVRSLPSGMLSYDKNGLFEVAAVPTGFMRIRRAAIERMVEKNEDRWYNDPTAPNLTVHRLFFTELHNHQLWSEDFAFCKHWREKCGGKVFVDPNLTLYHTGPQMFTGNFAKFLKDNPEVGDKTPVQPAAPVSLLDRVKAAASE